MDNSEEKLQLVAFSTNDSRHTPNDIIGIFLTQHEHNIIQKSNKVLAFSIMLPISKEIKKIMICSILNITVEYSGINEVNCYLLFIDLENENSKMKFDSIMNYFKDFCELSKKVYVLGMVSGYGEEVKFIEKEYIIKKLDKIKIHYEYQEINLNNIKGISESIMNILVYCSEYTTLYNDNMNWDKGRAQSNSCEIV